MTHQSRYQIIEGSPNRVAATCEQACIEGWELNGNLHMFTVGERVIAFQGIVKKPIQIMSQHKQSKSDLLVPESKSVPSWGEPQ